MAIYRLPPSPFVGGRQPLDSRDLNPSAEAVEVNEPPPKVNPILLATILIAWQPLPFTLQPQRFTPQEFVAAEQVPFTRNNIDTILTWWIPPSPQPQVSVKLVTEFVVEEKIPFRQVRSPYYVDYLIPQLPRRLPLDILAVAVNDPPFGQRIWLNNIVRAWEPPPPLPTIPNSGFTPPPTSDIILWMWKRIA